MASGFLWRILPRFLTTVSRPRKTVTVSAFTAVPTPRKKWAAASRPTATAPARAPSSLWNYPRPQPAASRSTQEHKETYERHRPETQPAHPARGRQHKHPRRLPEDPLSGDCLLYTSDAAD